MQISESLSGSKTKFQLKMKHRSCFRYRYLRLSIEEVTGLIIDSSHDRMETFSSFPAPRTKEDVIKMLGDRSGKRHCVFCESNKEEPVKTVAVGGLRRFCFFHLIS